MVRTIGELAQANFAAARKLVRKLPKTGRSPALLVELGQIYLGDLGRAGWNPIALETMPQRRFTAARLALAALFKGY